MYMFVYVYTTDWWYLLNGKTENVQATSGVLHGDTLAPFLFIALIVYVLLETLLKNIDGFT